MTGDGAIGVTRGRPCAYPCVLAPLARVPFRGAKGDGFLFANRACGDIILG